MWREAKKSNREEKEKFEIIFSYFERRRRNQKILSLVSRREREIWKQSLNFREEKERGIFFSQASRGERECEKRFIIFEKRQRNLKCCSPTLRREREIWKQILHFWDEKEKLKLFSKASKEKENFVFSNFSSNCFPERIHSHIDCIYLSFLHYVSSNVSSNGLPKVTLVAFVWLFSTVSFQTNVQRVCLRGCKVTLVAFVCDSSSVNSQMNPQMACNREYIVTLVAFAWLFSIWTPKELAWENAEGKGAKKKGKKPNKC